MALLRGVKKMLVVQLQTGASKPCLVVGLSCGQFGRSILISFGPAFLKVKGFLGNWNTLVKMINLSAQVPLEWVI